LPDWKSAALAGGQGRLLTRATSHEKVRQDLTGDRYGMRHNCCAAVMAMDVDAHGDQMESSVHRVRDRAVKPATVVVGLLVEVGEEKKKRKV